MIISITDLIPEGFFYLKKEYNIFLAIFILIIAMFLGYILNSMIGKQISKSKKEKGSLYKLGILSMIALILHNLPEGILTFFLFLKMKMASKKHPCYCKSALSW